MFRFVVIKHHGHTYVFYEGKAKEKLPENYIECSESSFARAVESLQRYEGHVVVNLNSHAWFSALGGSHKRPKENESDKRGLKKKQRTHAILDPASPTSLSSTPPEAREGVPKETKSLAKKKQELETAAALRELLSKDGFDGIQPRKPEQQRRQRLWLEGERRNNVVQQKQRQPSEQTLQGADSLLDIGRQWGRVQARRGGDRHPRPTLTERATPFGSSRKELELSNPKLLSEVKNLARKTKKTVSKGFPVWDNEAEGNLDFFYSSRIREKTQQSCSECPHPSIQIGLNRLKSQMSASPEAKKNSKRSADAPFLLLALAKQASVTACLNTQFSAESASEEYFSYVRKKGGSRPPFKQLLWLLPTGKATHEIKQFHGQVKTKISRDHLCFAKSTGDVNVGSALNLAYIKSALDSKGEEAVLKFMMLELMDMLEVQATLQTIHFFEVAVDHHKKTVVFRTHVFCKAWKSVLGSPSGLIFDSYEKILHCLFFGNNAISSPEGWNFRASLEIVEPMMYFYYNQKMFSSSRAFFPTISYAPLQFSLEQARKFSLDSAGKSLDALYQEYFKVSLEANKPLVQFWDFVTPFLYDHRNQLIENLFQEIIYSRPKNFHTTLQSYERQQYKEPLREALEEEPWGLTFVTKGTLKGTSKYNEKIRKLKKDLTAAAKKLYKRAKLDKDNFYNALGKLFLADMRLQELIRGLKTEQKVDTLYEKVEKMFDQKDLGTVKEIQTETRKFVANMMSHAMRFLSTYILQEKNIKEWWHKNYPHNSRHAITNAGYMALESSEKANFKRDPSFILFYSGVLRLDPQHHKIATEIDKSDYKENDTRYFTQDVVKGKKVKKDKKTYWKFYESETVKWQRSTRPHLQGNDSDEFFMATPLTSVNEIMNILESRADIIRFEGRLKRAVQRKKGEGQGKGK